MDPVMKAKWLKALLSGKYKQGKSCLRSMQDRFCCLGVLCDVYDRTAWSLRESPFALYNYITSSSELPVELRKQLGITVVQQQDLIRLNDFEDRSFEKIAKYIEENL